MLSILSAYIPQIPPVTIDGIFGPATENAVIAAQRRFGLTPDGIVGRLTWDEIYDQFSGIENTTLRDTADFPYTAQTAGVTPRNAHARTSVHTQFPGRDLRQGGQDPVDQEVVR